MASFFVIGMALGTVVFAVRYWFGLRGGRAKLTQLKAIAESGDLDDDKRREMLTELNSISPAALRGDYYEVYRQILDRLRVPRADAPAPAKTATVETPEAATASAADGELKTHLDTRLDEVCETLADLNREVGVLSGVASAQAVVTEAKLADVYSSLDLGLSLKKETVAEIGAITAGYVGLKFQALTTQMIGSQPQFRDIKSDDWRLELIS